MTKFIEIRRDVLSFLRDEARAVYPFECCGLLLGNLGSITRAAPAMNLNTEPRGGRYQIDPGDQRQIEIQAREEKLAVVGYYHSHPDRSARPSTADQELAWFGYSYLIIALDQQEILDVKSWRIDDTGRFFLEEPIRVIDEFAEAEETARAVENG
jgi:proteasome lid subunit RPN8/RPN11